LSNISKKKEKIRKILDSDELEQARETIAERRRRQNELTKGYKLGKPAKRKLIYDRGRRDW
jgi:hypothetical protein